MNKMHKFELQIILDDVYYYGEFKEKEVLKNLVKIELVVDTKEHKIYHFENSDGKYFEYDYKSHRLIK